MKPNFTDQPYRHTRTPRESQTEAERAAALYAVKPSRVTVDGIVAVIAIALLAVFCFVEVIQ